MCLPDVLSPDSLIHLSWYLYISLNPPPPPISCHISCHTWRIERWPFHCCYNLSTRRTGSTCSEPCTLTRRDVRFAFWTRKQQNREEKAQLSNLEIGQIFMKTAFISIVTIILRGLIQCKWGGPLCILCTIAPKKQNAWTILVCVSAQFKQTKPLRGSQRWHMSELRRRLMSDGHGSDYRFNAHTYKHNFKHKTQT